jgi:hypothetical protein
MLPRPIKKTHMKTLTNKNINQNIGSFMQEINIRISQKLTKKLIFPFKKTDNINQILIIKKQII